MKNKTFRSDFSDLFRNLRFTVPIILVALFGYGYTFGKLSISVDDMTAERYTLGDELLSQGRYTAVLFKRFFGLYRNVPHFGDMLCVLLFIVAMYVFAVVLMRASDYKLRTSSLALFACLTLSYSLMNEIYVYNGGNINVTLGFFLTSFALYFTQEFFRNKKKYNLICSLLLLIAVVSLYESFVIVYTISCISILILGYYYKKDGINGKFGKTLLRGIIMLIPIVLAIVIEYFLGKGINAIFDIGQSDYIANESYWFQDTSTFTDIIRHFAESLIYNYIIASKFYLPIRTMVIASNLVFIYGIVEGIRKRNITIALLYIAPLVVICAFNLVLGRIAGNRMCQYYAVFVAFFVMLAYEKLLDDFRKVKREKVKKVGTVAVCFFAALLVFYQTYDLNAWLCLDVRRYEYEKELVTSVCEELYKNYDIENKQVLFIGNAYLGDTLMEECSYTADDPFVIKVADILENFDSELAENIRTLNGKERRSFLQTNLTSYIYWANYAFSEPNAEIEKFCKFLGFDKINFCDNEYVLRAANFETRIMNAWPQEGSITEEGDYIVVNFGSISAIEEMFDED